MPKLNEIAVSVFEELALEVLARRQRTYGFYAAKLGADPGAFAQAIGQAMHAIGAVCIIRRVPVMPLFWVTNVEGADAGDASVFLADGEERSQVVDSGDFDAMYVVAREHHYTDADMDSVGEALRAWTTSTKVGDYSPHRLWRRTFLERPAGADVTYYQRAMAAYRGELEELKSRRRAAAPS